MFSGFLEGRAIDSAIIGIIYFIFLEILNVPYAALLAVICGVTNIIPFFGPFIGGFIGGVIILAADPIKLIPFIIFVFVIQFFDGYILDPHIVGGYLQLSSFSIVFAVLLCGGLWGFTGMLIGVPLFAVIYDIVKKICFYILKKKGRYDLVIKYRKEFKDSRPNSIKKRRGKRTKKLNEVTASEENSTPEACSDVTVTSSSEIE